jgi:hypothetical protein
MTKLVSSGASLQDQFTLMVYAHRHAMDNCEEYQKHIYRDGISAVALRSWEPGLRHNVWRANLARCEAIRINAAMPKHMRKSSSYLDAIMPYYDADKCVAAVRKLGDACKWPVSQ